MSQRKGQALVEVALILPVVMLLLLGFIQLVVLGNVALSLNQAANTCARYASINPGADQSAVNSYLQSIASPIINDNGLDSLTLAPTSVPRATGTALTVTVSYNLNSKLFLGSSFFGVNFPASIQASESMTSE